MQQRLNMSQGGKEELSIDKVDTPLELRVFFGDVARESE